MRVPEREDSLTIAAGEDAGVEPLRRRPVA
jgi:hypothetical protein